MASCIQSFVWSRSFHPYPLYRLWSHSVAKIPLRIVDWSWLLCGMVRRWSMRERRGRRMVLGLQRDWRRRAIHISTASRVS